MAGTNKVNQRKTYAIINSETQKILKYDGKLEYYRTKVLAEYRTKMLQSELGINLEVKKLNDRWKS